MRAHFASVMIFNNREMLHKREVTFSDDVLAVVDVVFAKLPYVIGSFSIDDGDGKKNVT